MIFLLVSRSPKTYGPRQCVPVSHIEGQQKCPHLQTALQIYYHWNAEAGQENTHWYHAAEAVQTYSKVFFSFPTYSGPTLGFQHPSTDKRSTDQAQATESSAKHKTCKSQSELEIFNGKTVLVCLQHFHVSNLIQNCHLSLKTNSQWISQEYKSDMLPTWKELWPNKEKNYFAKHLMSKFGKIYWLKNMAKTDKEMSNHLAIIFLFVERAKWSKIILWMIVFITWIFELFVTLWRIINLFLVFF